MLHPIFRFVEANSNGVQFIAHVPIILIASLCVPVIHYSFYMNLDEMGENAYIVILSNNGIIQCKFWFHAYDCDLFSLTLTIMVKTVREQG
jgi:hypothetical protein